MRTTIDINDAILEQLKAKARQEKRPLKALLNEALILGLGRLSRKPLSTFKVKGHPLGMKQAYRGMSLNKLYDELEAEDASQQHKG